MTRERHQRKEVEDLTRAGVNRRATEHLPAVRPCFGPCGKMTRPSMVSVEDAPGTITRRSAFYCSACKRRLGDTRPAALADVIAKIETADSQRGKEEITPEVVLHAAKGLNRFMAQRQQREHRRERLAKVGNVAAPDQPQPRGNGGGRMAAAAHGPRPVPGHQQVAGTARVHAEGAPGGTDLLQRRA